MTSDEPSSLVSKMSGVSDLAFEVSAVSGEKSRVPPVQGLGTEFRQVPSAKLDLVGGTPHHLFFFWAGPLPLVGLPFLVPYRGALHSQYECPGSAQLKHELF